MSINIRLYNNTNAMLCTSPRMLIINSFIASAMEVNYALDSGLKCQGFDSDGVIPAPVRKTSQKTPVYLTLN